jgi:hypothetical protein
MFNGKDGSFDIRGRAWIDEFGIPFVSGPRPFSIRPEKRGRDFIGRPHRQLEAVANVRSASSAPRTTIGRRWDHHTRNQSSNGDGTKKDGSLSGALLQFVAVFGCQSQTVDAL